MSMIECVFFDCDGTLVDSERICCQAYLLMFGHYGVELSFDMMFKQYKGVKLYEIIEIINKKYGIEAEKEQMEAIFRQHLAQLFEQDLQPIAGIPQLLPKIKVPMCVVSNGPVSKMQHTLGLTGLLPYMKENLFSGYDLKCWKPDPTLLFHAAEKMNCQIERCILVEDSQSGVQAGIAAGIPVFYYCADHHNPEIAHPLVQRFTDMQQLPELWRQRGYDLTN
jgi:HAD superfamily hydrolase (TIGR01509 family)